MGRKTKLRKGTAAYNLANKTVSSKKTPKVKPKVDASVERMPVFELENFIVKGKSPFKRGTPRHTAHHKMYSRRRGLIT